MGSKEEAKASPCDCDSDHGHSHHFRSEGDKLFRGLLSELSSSRIQLHLSLVAKEPHNHKQHSTRGPTSCLYNYTLSKSKAAKLWLS